MTTVTLYTKPNCIQCTQTKRLLDRQNIPYLLVDVTTERDALNYVKEELGYLGAPVITVQRHGNLDHWYGFRPDLIKGIHP